jgi:hypothetical protein
MSFRLFIYYCALCGGWAAFLAWGVVALADIRRVEWTLVRAALVGGVLGALVGGALGAVDAVLNSRGLQRFLRALICLVLGGLSGLAGGFAGELVKMASSSAFVFVGWILAGALIGASIGVFDVLAAIVTHQDVKASFNKLLNGLYGGFLGGLVGGLPFTFLVGHETLRHSSLTISLVALGICIGLLIGLAQVVLKEAWISVEAGFRAGRQLLLTRDVFTIGRAEACDLGLFGDNTIEKTHARILLKNNRYLLEDADTESGTYLNDYPVTRQTPLKSGDTIRVGRSVLRFGERQKRNR